MIAAQLASSYDCSQNISIVGNTSRDALESCSRPDLRSHLNASGQVVER
jgi:hypothetical protein